MRNEGKIKRITAFCLAAVMGIMTLQGCGEEEKEQADENPKEHMTVFTSEDGSVSLMLDKEWIISNEEQDEPSWIFAASEDETEAVVVMQFPKYITGSVMTCLEDAEALVEESYSYYGSEVEAPVISNMYNVEASIGEVDMDGDLVGGYVVYGETDYASYMIAFYADDMDAALMKEMLVACSTFQEDSSKINGTATEMTETVQWFNTVNALIIEENDWYHEIFAGLPVNEETMIAGQDMMSQSWNVTDRVTADENWQWIMEEGNRKEYLEDMQTLADWGLAEIPSDERSTFLWTDCEMEFMEASFWADMYNLYEEKGAIAINGWDYCCAMEFIQGCYLAGYYTETEALDMALEVGQLIQGQFTSWDDLMESYMNGYRYWADEDSYEYQILYQELKARSDGPYAVEFYTTLEKTW